MSLVTHGGPSSPASDAIKYLRDLIAFPTVSSSSNVAITDHVATVFRQLGFAVTKSTYRDRAGVEKANLVAIRRPTGQVTDNTVSPDAGPDQSLAGGLAYFCHTDVVPAQNWIGPTDLSGSGRPDADPFHAVESEGRIYGRGACDMKGSLAAMLAAACRVSHESQRRPIWIVCTADEEVGFDGAKYLADHCTAFAELVRYDPVSIIGEPTELQVVHAHKGIRGIKLQATGKAGHSATDFGRNANESMVPVLQTLLEICQRTRRETTLLDDRFEPPVLSWNFGVSDHARAINITPDRSDAWVSFRPMPNIDGQQLIDEVTEVATQHGVSAEVIDGCAPMWTSPETAAVKMMETLSGSQARTVSYATDGGVWNQLNQRIVIGPGSIAQAHTVDEWITIEQLELGVRLYERSLQQWAC
ncbi:M20 family metallopeptidase [Roseiconus lacunae]|uniref:M20 family metallopeptidase n=1 Tax=Roseiconus lacunae TaxID=2605694 RepID=UPI00308B84C4|nr:M20 family metallopeptidase [Stieleria sp. HD01]